MVKETPALYQSVVQPYIEQFPQSRFEWQVVLVRLNCYHWTLEHLKKGLQHSLSQSRIWQTLVWGQWPWDGIYHSSGHEMGSEDDFFSISCRHHPLALYRYPTRSHKGAYSYSENDSSWIWKAGKGEMEFTWRAVPTILHPLPAFLLCDIDCVSLHHTDAFIIKIIFTFI